MYFDLLTTKEAAKWLNTSVRSLERWRANGTGPHSIKDNGYIRYRVEDLKRWLEDNRTI